jgi:hypothetical protein
VVSLRSCQLHSQGKTHWYPVIRISVYFLLCLGHIVWMKAHEVKERPVSNACLFYSHNSHPYVETILNYQHSMCNPWLPWDLLKMDGFVTICNYLRNENFDDVMPRLSMSGTVCLLPLCALMACTGTTVRLPIIV